MLQGWSFGQCGQVFKNIKMRKTFNYNMSSYGFTTFSREHDNVSLFSAAGRKNEEDRR